jgi:cytochrome oxidase Cu insertion factor (SCO1/SenC/PrrC family)
MLGVEVMAAAAEDAAAHEAGTTHSAADGHTGGYGSEHGDDYEVSHSGRFVLIDRDWQIRSYYNSAALDQDELVAAIWSLAR